MKHQQKNNANESIAVSTAARNATSVSAVSTPRPEGTRAAPAYDPGHIATPRSRTGLAATLALLAGGLSVALPAAAQSDAIVEDCILEGTVDMRKAEQLDQPVYVRFSDAERGSEAGCSLNRRSKSRRVRFITTPDMHDIENVSHGAKVRYRYIERDGEPGTWQLIGVRDER